MEQSNKIKTQSKIETKLVTMCLENTESIKIFTDGSCIGNGFQSARAGIGICSDLENFNDISEEITGLGYFTNNHAELYAIYKACDMCIELKLENS